MINAVSNKLVSHFLLEFQHHSVLKILNEVLLLQQRPVNPPRVLHPKRTIQRSTVIRVLTLTYISIEVMRHKLLSELAKISSIPTTKKLEFSRSGATKNTLQVSKIERHKGLLRDVFNVDLSTYRAVLKHKYQQNQ